MAQRPARAATKSKRPSRQKTPAEPAAAKAAAKTSRAAAAGKTRATLAEPGKRAQPGPGAKPPATAPGRPATKPARGRAAPSKPAETDAAAPTEPSRAAATRRASASGKAAAAKAKPQAAATPKRPRRRQAPAYLAAELGQPVDHEGEPIGAGSPRVQDDAELQDYALRLWRQMQSGGVVKRYLRAIERAGLTVDEVWTAGLGEARATSSTPDEMRRYKQRLLFRANLLEALLTETIADLHRLDGIQPTPPRESSIPSAAA